MLKRIVTIILSVALAAVMLCGCSFVSFNNERDLRQEVAKINPYTIKNIVTTEDGDDSSSKEYVYNAPAKTIYKRDLIEYVNNNASNLSSTYGTDYEGLYRYAVDMLINVELVINEVDALIDCGKIEWGLTEQNAVKKNIYSVIDNSLLSIKNTILSGRDMEEIVADTTDPTEAETTYPVKPEETDDGEAGDNENKYDKDTEVWEPDTVRWPGMNGDADTRSLEKEAMRRFILLLESNVENDFRVTDAERKVFEKESEAIKQVIDTKGIEYVYPLLGTYPVSDDEVFGHYMYYISGKSYERSQKITAMQNYLSDGVSVGYDDVAQDFRAKINEQKSLYAENVSAFDTAISGGNTTILYYPNNNYFYVKHILLPFSDAQKAALTAYGNDPAVANLEDSEKKAKVEAYRNMLADAIVCYPHKDGENDLTKPMTVDEVMNHISSVMKPLKGAAADLAFDDLVYLYGTDPGSFGNNKGYVVKYRLDAGESETYMQEFADAARYMRDNIGVGEVYYEKVVTDYGVHIMYLASVTQPGEVQLHASTTPGNLETYYDVLEEPLLSSRRSAAYQNWESKVIQYNRKANSVIYDGNFSNLWGE